LSNYKSRDMDNLRLEYHPNGDIHIIFNPADKHDYKESTKFVAKANSSIPAGLNSNTILTLYIQVKQSPKDRKKYLSGE